MSAIVPYTALIQQFKAAPPGKLYSLYGSKGVFRLSLYAASHALMNGVPITLIDGTNRFDAYYIAEFARQAAKQRNGKQHLRPEDLLENIFISRAFTCYQMEAVITRKLSAFMKKKQSHVVIIFGLLDTFFDEQAPFFEVKSSVQRIIAALHNLKRENISVLLASREIQLAAKERKSLMPKVKAAMDQVFYLTETEHGQILMREPHQSLEYGSKSY